MKKLFILLSTVILLVSCGEKLIWSKDYNRVTPFDKTAISASEENQTSVGDVVNVYSVEYREHKYIIFTNGAGLFVINDPDE